MRKSFCISLFFIYGTFIASSQLQLTWDDFADVSFEPKYNSVYEMDFLTPVFGDQIQLFRGKEVEIIGYFLDLSGNGEIFLVSRNPMDTCFFCGTAGPETIIEVEFKENPSFKTDQIVLVRGVLELNDDDVEHCNYLLKDAAGELMEY